VGIVVFFSELVKLLVDRWLAGVVYVEVRLMYEPHGGRICQRKRQT